LYGIIYCVYCTVTGKCYIGQTTKGISQRWSQHIADANRNHIPFSRAIAEHGADAFELSILAEANSQEQLDELEAKWILLKRSYDPEAGYNRRFGGISGKLTIETKATMSKAQYGHSSSPEARARQSKAMKGRQSHNKGVPMSDEQRLKMQDSWYRDRENLSFSPAAVYARIYRKRKRLAALAA
jgi:group I intron endonuclease